MKFGIFKFLIVLYLGIIFVIPGVLNMPFVQNLIVSKIENKTSSVISYSGLKFSLSPRFEPKIKADNVVFSNKDIVLELKDAEFSNGAFSANTVLKTRYLTTPVKISKGSVLYFKGKKIFTENFRIYAKGAPLVLSGELYNKKKEPDFTIKAEGIYANDIVSGFLTFKKAQSDKKIFIENFYNFKGTIDLDLSVNSSGLTGVGNIKNISAISTLLDVPLQFKNLKLIFDKKEIYTKCSGKAGGEDMALEFYLSGLFTPNMEITGSVTADITDKFAKKYVEGLYIKNTISLNVDYLVKNGVVDILYSALAPAGSNLSYNGAYLGLSSYDRAITASTHKNGDDFVLTDYAYSIETGSGLEELIFGNADFTKKDGRFTLKNLYAQTKTNAPVSLLGFIESRLDGGYFNGSLNYDFLTGRLLGAIVLENSYFKDFKIKSAAVFGDEKLLSILADGTYLNEILTANVEMKNGLKDDLEIYKLDCYLAKYIQNDTPGGEKNEFKPPEFDRERFENYPKISIDDFSLELGEFKHGEIYLQNIALNGYAKNEILNFKIPGVLFAEGKLKGNGFMDFKNEYLDINFEADDIDSNIAAGQVFNLKDQFKGLASAKLHVEGPFKLRSIKGAGEFKIENGSLSKIGSTEFIVSAKKRKFPLKIEKIIKVKNSSELDADSDITGFFDFIDNKISNAVIYLKNESLSLFIEGSYDINSTDTALKLWGKLNKKVERNVSIFKIPLGIFTRILFKSKIAKENYDKELARVPSGAQEAEYRQFYITLDGKLDDYKNLKTLFKGLE